MVKVYAVVLVLGIIALIGWIFIHAFAQNSSVERFDPEDRFGISGRRVVAGMVGFGMAGMSAEFSPRDLSWPIALVLAAIGSGVLAWYAGWVDSGSADGDSDDSLRCYPTDAADL